MLRLDEDFSEYHARCRSTESHRAAAEACFGRLLRSADLFEDIVKVICTCNVSWGQTVAMIDNIVRHWGVPAGPDGQTKGFPTPIRLAAVDIDELRQKARVGYRASFVRHMSEAVAAGDLDLAALEGYTGPTDALAKALREIPGVGDYAAAHLCMLLGRYDRLAIDTELLRHLRTRHPRRTWTPAAIRRHYAPWHPYQFLAYWFELWQEYADRHGRPDQWDPSVTGVRITATPPLR
jgi:3-methyladenine DNA glycosylase/8-oxoguanine DNA glycosylase